MFFSIAWRNAKRSRSENLIYFLTMVTAIATFYIVLSLGEQDVMRFLSELESDAVDRLLTNLVLVPRNFWTYIWFYLYNGYSGGELDPLFSGNFNLVPTFLKAQTGEFTIGRWVRTMLEGNLIIFLPMGFFLPFVSKTINTRNIFAFAVITPIAIELLQPVIGRSFDVDDVMMNFAGIIIGYFITLGIKATAAKR